MVTIYDVPVNDLIVETSKELKNNPKIVAPDWSKFVKTGVSKQRPPVDSEWWFVRAAAILRSVYKLGPIGVSKLRKKYGSKKNRGHKPEKFFPASGNIIRKSLQQLRSAGFIMENNKTTRKGNTITPSGKSFLDKIATEIYKESTSKQKTKQPVESVKPVKQSVKQPVESVKPVKQSVKQPVESVKPVESVESKKE